MSDLKEPFGRLEDAAEDTAGQLAESISGTVTEVLADREDEASSAAVDDVFPTKERMNRLLKN